jgi:hypothetical protein
MGPAEAAARLGRLRAQVATAVPGLQATGQETPEEFTGFLAWAEARLGRLAVEHGFAEETVLVGT